MNVNIITQINDNDKMKNKHNKDMFITKESNVINSYRIKWMLKYDNAKNDSKLIILILCIENKYQY